MIDTGYYAGTPIQPEEIVDTVKVIIWFVTSFMISIHYLVCWKKSDREDWNRDFRRWEYKFQWGVDLEED